MPKYILFLAKLKGERRPFWSGQAQAYPLNYLLHVGGNGNNYKSVNHPNLALPVVIGYSLEIFQTISKVYFHLSVQAYSLLGQTKEERKACFGGCKKEGCIVRLSQRTLGCHKKWKSLLFCEIWNNPNLLSCLLDPLTNKHYRAWGYMMNLLTDSNTCYQT